MPERRKREMDHTGSNLFFHSWFQYSPRNSIPIKFFILSFFLSLTLFTSKSTCRLHDCSLRTTTAAMRRSSDRVQQAAPPRAQKASERSGTWLQWPSLMKGTTARAKKSRSSQKKINLEDSRWSIILIITECQSAERCQNSPDVWGQFHECRA